MKCFESTALQEVHNIAIGANTALANQTTDSEEITAVGLCML